MATPLAWTSTTIPWPRRISAAFTPLDKLTALYTVCSASILIGQSVGRFGAPMAHNEIGWLLTAHFLLLVLVGLASEARRRAAEKGCVLADWYPLFILTAVYGSVGLLNGPRATGGVSFDGMVQHWEAATFGRQLAYDWSRTASRPALSWPLGLSYLLFFPTVILAPAALWWKGYRARARQTIFGISLVFLTCYLLFLIFPVAGPSYLWGWPTPGAGSDFPTRMVRQLIDDGDSWGSAFPSSHVAASTAAVLLALKHWRALGWLLLPVAAGILVGVVYFQVHYAMDAVAGLAIALMAVWATPRLAPLDDRET
ncbi:MAG: phosphatase PAP2 family protein [Gemmatimonadota bacterium]